MTAYADEDIQAAKRLVAEDDVIDTCYNNLYSKVVQILIDDPRNIDRANYVIWVAHNLERLGDRATNICERVFFIVTGERYQEAFQMTDLSSVE
jgi:phosphate transport system protein